MSTYSQHSTSSRTWFLPAILASILLLSGACASVSPTEKKLMAQQKYTDAQNPGHSKKEKYKKLMEAIRMAPEEPLYRVGLGDEYFKDEKFDKAEKMYLSALKADPKFMISYRMLGRLYMQKGQWEDAVHYLRRALDQPNVINPVQLYNWLAYSEYRRGDLAKAEKAWLRALDINDSGRVRLNLALIYKEGNRLDLAQASLLKALEINPKLPSAHFALGEIYYQRNKFKKAKKHFSEVIQLEPLSEQAKTSQEILNKLSATK
jgi:tetratricopeptide (TPR) repeat protein